jgi:N-glycosylase/DNA lyase
MTEAFMNWLSTIASAYPRKGRVAPSYEILVERFIEGLEVEPSEEATDALYSLAYELDSEHEANSVYRYHIEQVLVSYQEAEDEEDEEDEFWNLFDEEEYEEEEEEESHYGW